MIAVPWVAVVAGLALLLGLVMVLGGRGMRRRRGLDGGKTIALDNATLTDEMRRYTEDGRLEIDNNTSERTLRLCAIGRKN